jgi:hypothetical protein
MWQGRLASESGLTHYIHIEGHDEASSWSWITTSRSTHVLKLVILNRNSIFDQSQTQIDTIDLWLLSPPVRFTS